MKRLIGLLLTAILLAGCMSGGGPYSTPTLEVHSVLDKLEVMLITQDLSEFDSIFNPVRVDGSGDRVSRDTLREGFIYLFSECDIMDYSIARERFTFNTSNTVVAVSVTEYLTAKIKGSQDIESDWVEGVYRLSKDSSGKWLITQSANWFL